MTLRAPAVSALAVAAVLAGVAWVQATGVAAQGNPWMPETSPLQQPQYAPSTQYPGQAPTTGNGWGVPQSAPSLYAPADLDQQLSVAPGTSYQAPATTYQAPVPSNQQPVASPYAPASGSTYQPAPLQTPVPTAPQYAAPQYTAPQYAAPATTQPGVQTVPGSVAPTTLAPSPYAAVPYVGTYPVVPITPVVPPVGTYMGTLPYGSATPTPGYGWPYSGYGGGYPGSGWGGYPGGGWGGYPGTTWGNNGWNNSYWPGTGGGWPLGGFSPFGFW